MATLSEALGDIAKETVCGILDTGNGALGLLNRIGLPTTGVQEINRKVRGALCSDPTSPNIPPSDSTGNCPTAYNIVVNYSYINNGNPETAVATGNNIQGPLGAVGFDVYYGPFDDGLRFKVSTPSGVVYFGERGGYGYDDLVITSTSKTRVDGLPDDCGPPDNGGRPTPQVVNNNNITYINNEGTEINGSVNLVVFAPITNFNGEVSFPITFDLGGVEFNGELNMNGEINLNPTFNFPIGQEDPPINPPPDLPEDDPEDDRRIIGVKVYVQQNDGRTVGKIMQGDNPDILIPRAGSVQFLVRAGERLAWSNDIPVKTSVAYIPCPPPGFATRVAGTPAIGVEWELNPVYGTPVLDE